MKRILFVDADSSVLGSLQQALTGERKRWELHFASSGEAALDACSLMPFDVVLSAIELPGLDGIALMQWLRECYPDCGRVLLSEQIDLSLATRAASAAYRVLSKPLQPQLIIFTIERICLLQDAFTNAGTRDVIGRIGGLPSLSSTYLALALAVRNPESSIAEVAGIIEQDVAMAAKVLQIVNSGFFGLLQTMNNLQTAVSYLGMETIKNLALATETFTIFVPDACIPSSFLETMHRRSERCAIIVGALPLNARERDVCVVAALLHDVGELVLASRMPAQFSAALKLAKESACTGYEAEETLIGLSHAELGAYLLGLWGIGGLIVEAVAHHHRPLRVPHTSFDSTTALYLAALIADEFELHPLDVTGKELRKSDSDSLKALELSEQYPLLRARAVRALQMR